MAKLVYTTIASLDGYITDEAGAIDWAEPDPEVFGFINDLERGIGTYLTGRRLYETMLYWETFDAAEEQSPHVQSAAIWRKAAKIVYSRTLGTVSSARNADRAGVRPDRGAGMKATAAHDLTVGGPTSPVRRWLPAWSTRSISFSCPSWSGAGRPHCPATSTPTSNCWAWTDSPVASSTFTTASADADRRTENTTGVSRLGDACGET